MVGVPNEEGEGRQVTIEILKSIARNGQVFTLEQLHRQTGIRKVFIENYRFSDDFDFTLLEPYEMEHLREFLAGKGIAREQMAR